MSADKDWFGGAQVIELATYRVRKQRGTVVIEAVVLMAFGWALFMCAFGMAWGALWRRP